MDVPIPQRSRPRSRKAAGGRLGCGRCSDDMTRLGQRALVSRSQSRYGAHIFGASGILVFLGFEGITAVGGGAGGRGRAVGIKPSALASAEA